MKPKEITQLIEKEINGDWSISNLHGCDLKKCLVRPRKRPFVVFGGEKRDFYLVLEENPETCDGYKIVFDDEKKRFGLAQYGEPYDYFLCYYDSFLITFKGM